MIDFNKLYTVYCQHGLFGRYIPPLQLDKVLEDIPHTILGFSTQQRPIRLYRWGHGKTQVLIWSHMHGNESTTTKALADLMACLWQDASLQPWASQLTLHIIPMVNPDGAWAHTRQNAADVDLNRDALDLTQPESRLLMAYIRRIQPGYCFNLHDQRSIFGLGNPPRPATLSFLAPSFDATLQYDAARKRTACLIGAVVRNLNSCLPHQIGRFDDAFDARCFGDRLQQLHIPCVLFEAGHFPSDYDREQVRKYVFLALGHALSCISENDIVDNDFDFYLHIPQNEPLFYDFVYKNIKIFDGSNEKIINFAAQYFEQVTHGTYHRHARISALDTTRRGHVEFDGEEGKFQAAFGQVPQIEQLANFKLIYPDKSIEFVNGTIKT